MIIPSQIIAIILTKSTSLVQTSHGNFSNIVANPLLCIEIPHLYVIPAVCTFSEKQLNQIPFSVINLGHKDLTIEKIILWYTTFPIIMSCYLLMMKILALKMYTTMYTPVRKVILQDAENSKTTQEKLDCLLENFADIMSSC